MEMASSESSPNGRPKADGKDRVILVLIIVVTLMGSALLVMVVDDLDLFEPPYSSESTALSLNDGDIVWTGQYDHWMGENETFDYRNLRLAWKVEGEGMGATTNEIVNHTLLSSGALATANRSLHYFSIQVTDLLGNGLFERGDFITFDFTEFGIPEDTVHTVALADVACEWNQEFSFAIHDGEFYSWSSDELPADYPWWVHP